MVRTKILDDTFVIEQIPDTAHMGRPLLKLPHDLLKISQGIKKCVNKLINHYGYTKRSKPSPRFTTDHRFLVLGLSILGKRLGLYHAFNMIEHTIEMDWISHTELTKEGRYRDHITHPVRVTAIGWWFLHRERGALLNKLAKDYRIATDEYRKLHKIALDGRTWKEIVEFAWLAAGLMHDCALPLEYHFKSGQHLRNGISDTLGIIPCAPEPFNHPNDLLAPLGSSWFFLQLSNLKKRVKKICNPGKDQFNHAHALIGGLHHCLEIERNNQLHTLQGLVVQMAARAIISHHDSTRGTSIISDPLATLLFVSDNLQNWNRPHIHKELSKSANDVRTFRPLVECKEIRLEPDKGGYVAVHCMNEAEKKILKKTPYSWCFRKFCEPRGRLEKLINRQGMLPRVTCSQRRCIDPKNFPK